MGQELMASLDELAKAHGLLSRWNAQCRRSAPGYDEALEAVFQSGRKQRAQRLRDAGFPHIVYPARDPNRDEAKAWILENLSPLGWRYYSSGLGAEYAFRDLVDATAFRMRWS